MTNTKSYEVTVKEAMHDDAGTGIARISADLMAEMGLKGGDVIEISAGKKTGAVVQTGFREDFGRRIIRIDGYIRSNIQTGIDEKVSIRKIEPVFADKIIVSSENEISFSGTEAYLARLFEGRPVNEGEGFRVSLMGRSYTFIIEKVSPSGIVIGGSGTKIEIKTSGSGSSSSSEISDVHYEDIGGLGREVSQVREMIELPLRHPEIFEKLGIQPPKGVLLYGPPGTGKTLIAKAVANEVSAKFISISGPEIVTGVYGGSEEKLRGIFEDAKNNAPAVIFIDEIDSIAPIREESKGEVERRIVAQLLTLMDGLNGRGQVIVIGATNLPDNIDPALRRGGRFDREIEIGIPDKKGRLEILLVHTRGVPLDVAGISVTGEEGIELSRKFAEAGEREGRMFEDSIKKRKFLEPFAAVTHGFVGADLALLVKEAAMHALRDEIKDFKTDDIPMDVIERIKVDRSDFEYALKHVDPSAMREVLVEVPDISWDDVGGLEGIKKELTESVEWPLLYPDVFSKLNTKPPSGILLFGPPGTGKTLLAKAVANKSECNFISVKGPELLSMWVGESEKGVRDIFKKARQAAPSIIFFDEIDALFPKRSSISDTGHVQENVVSQILTELDGIEELHGVTIIGATNRPDMLDSALMRPGRLDRHLYVPPPDLESRKKILSVYLKDADNLLAGGISIDSLAENTEGFVGADIEMLVREAKLQAIREFVSRAGNISVSDRKEMLTNVRITKEHFDEAFSKIKASMDKEGIREYERSIWKFIYPSDKCALLEQSAYLAGRLRAASSDNVSASQAKDELESAIYNKDKDFALIRRLADKAENILHESK